MYSIATEEFFHLSAAGAAHYLPDVIAHAADESIRRREGWQCDLLPIYFGDLFNKPETAVLDSLSIIVPSVQCRPQPL